MVKKLKKSELMNKILTEPRKLTLSQKNAVISEKRNVRIIAGAGAGKTETLTRRIVYLLLYEEVTPNAIVAFTFTEKAAQEMKSRIYQRIMEFEREDILRSLGEMYIGTIHGFCLRILQDHYGYGNYEVFDENQERAFIMRYGWSLNYPEEYGKNYSKNCENFLNTLGIVYNDMLDRKILKETEAVFYSMLEKYEGYLEDHKRLTFNRICYLAVDKILNDPEKLSHIRHLIVDEFQDVNLNQYRLITLIGKTSHVFVVGDPRQSIYQWRGSNEQFFLDFGKNFEDTELIQIRENWRSVDEIVRVSNEFADTFSNRDYEHLEPKRGEAGIVKKIQYSTPDEEARCIIEQIHATVEEKKCNFSDFGILLRSVTTSGGPFIETMKEMGIPYIVGGKIGLFRRDEAQAVGRLMAWLSDQGFWQEDPYHWQYKIYNEDLIKTGIQHWQDAVRFELSPNIELDLLRWKEDVLAHHQYDMKKIYDNLLIALGFLNFDPDDPLDAACMANLGRFSTMLWDFEIANKLGGRSQRRNSEIKNLCWFMNTYANTSYEEQSAEDLRSVNAVQIMTVHQAKGLEWPVVFLPALVSRRFPSSMAGTHGKYFISRDLFDAERYDGGIEEEKRLFYVAVTRARDRVFFSYFDRLANKVSQSIFLDIVDKIGVPEIPGNSFKLDYKAPERVVSDEIQTYAAKEIIQYLWCPHHYRLNHLWGYVQSHSPLRGYGESLHFCLRHAAELMMNEGLDIIGAVKTSVDDTFFLPFTRGDKFEKIKSTVRERLIKFALQHEEELSCIEEVEARLEFPVHKATIIGKADVILRVNDEQELWDYKSSDSVISKEDSSLQVQLYTLGLNEMGRNITRGAIATLDDARKEDVDLGDDNLQNSKSMAEQVIENIKAGCFQPKISTFCTKDCEYLNICKAGREHGR